MIRARRLGLFAESLRDLLRLANAGPNVGDGVLGVHLDYGIAL